MAKAHPRINEVKDSKIICGRCEAWKDPDEFARASRMKRGRHSWCTSCMSKYISAKKAAMPEVERERLRTRRRTYQAKWAREWREKNPDRQSVYTLKYRTGLTSEELERILLAQGGKCANPRCDAPADDVDHDHSCCSGQKLCGRCTRGILCHRCNTKLGSLERDLNLIEGLLIYLKEAQNSVNSQRIKDIHVAN